MIDEAATRDRTSAQSDQTVYLHIGTMKTGTSFLQHVLLRNAELLEADGVRYPLDGRGWALQVRAARDVLDIKGMPTQGGWDAMVDQIHAWPGHSVVSMEFYSLASPVRAKKVAAGLAPSRVEVIITARDLVRVIPSAWQSMIKQGHPWAFPDFVDSITGESHSAANDAHRRFWRHHDLVGITRRWAAAVGAENVHIVTVPPSGAPPSTLWERFCSVIGLDHPERYDVSQDRRSNFSLSYSDSELMRQINIALRDEIGRVAYKRWATRYFANRVLRASAGERTAHDRPGLTPAAHDWAVHRSQEMIDTLDDLGVHVVGDLAELMPARAPAGDAPTEPMTVYPEGAVHVIAALIRRIAEVDPQLPERKAMSAGLQDQDEAADAVAAREADDEAAADETYDGDPDLDDTDLDDSDLDDTDLDDTNLGDADLGDFTLTSDDAPSAAGRGAAS